MQSAIFSVFLFTVSINLAVSYKAASIVANSFAREGIVKDLGLKVPPKRILGVRYSSGESVTLGNELTPTQTKDVPSLYWDHRPGAYYTVLMTDLDVSSRSNPDMREVRHWLVMNIRNGDLETGDVVVEYIGAGPLKGTGLHRYVFLTFEQRGYIDTSAIPRISNRSAIGRVKTSTAKLMKEYNLGQPKFGNHYQAQYDDYVPILQKQIGNT